MTRWVNVRVFAVSMLAVGLASPACSVDDGYTYGSGGKAAGGTAGAAGTSGGASAGRAGAGGSASSGETSGGRQGSAEGGASGDGAVDLGGAGGEPGTDVGCGEVVCAAEATCTGAGVDARCECPTGYTDPRGDGTLCKDVDECANLNGGCEALVSCTNTPGSFSCGGCPVGYSGAPATGCVDIDECASKNGDCDALVTCTNTPGARVCGNCPFGYSGDGESGCTDIDECATNNGGCDKTVNCVNTAGAHTCGDCPAGYSGGGAAGCVDINECATSNGGCDVNATCTNSAGSRTCACKSGYAGDGISCTAPGAGCRWNCTGTNCVQVALDQDGDGRGTSACVAAPGDDCDDTKDAIFPGATELCDGIDNDCDRKIDLSDGLGLVGAIQNVPSLNHAAVASAGDGSFGVVGTSSSLSGLFYGTISANGAGSVSAGTIFSPSTSNAYLDPHLAWGSALGQWGVFYGMNGKGGLGAYAGVMAFTSCCWEDVSPPGASQNYPVRGDITARGQGDLLMAGASFGNLYLATQGPSGTTPLTGSRAITGSWDSYSPRVAASGTSSAVIWQTLTPRVLSWSLISSTLTFGAVEQLSTSASYADIAAINAGYGLAWIEGVGFRFMIKQPNGSTRCTSSVVPFGTVPSNQQIAVGDSANGTVVVATSPDSNVVHLYRFDNACKVIDDIDVSTTANAPIEPRVVLGGGHVVVYWTDSTGGHYRFLSDLLCH